MHLIHITVRTQSELGTAILERNLRLDWIPSLGMNLVLRVGNSGVNLPVEEIQWSEASNVFHVLTSFKINTSHSLVPFKTDVNWQVTGAS